MPFAKWTVPVFDYLVDLMAKNMSGARQDRFLEWINPSSLCNTCGPFV
jgi:hypothetical protein